MEICLNNIWMVACSTGWGDVDARVICRQLGWPVEGSYEIDNETCEILVELGESFSVTIDPEDL